MSEQALSDAGIAELRAVFHTCDDVRRAWLYRASVPTGNGGIHTFPFYLWAEVDEPPQSFAEEGALMRELTTTAHPTLLEIYRREEIRIDGVVPLAGHMLEQVRADGLLLYARQE